MARSISAEAKEDLQQLDLLPCTRITEDLSKEKVKMQRTQEMVYSTIIMPNPAYWPKGLPVTYKIQVPLYPYLQWLKIPGK